jgi:predicted Zn-dependent protease
MATRRRLVSVAGIAIVLMGATFVAFYVLRDERLPEGVSRTDYQNAEKKFRELYRKKGGRLDVLSVAGELAVADGRLPAALACFRAIPSATPRYGLPARLQEGQVLLRLNRAREAEHSFREYLERAARDPAVGRENLIAARKYLAYLLSVELRLEDRKSILADLHADGQADLGDSKQFFFPHLLLWHSSNARQRLSEFLAEDPDNPSLRAAEARYLTADGHLDEAQSRLETFIREHPGDLTGTAALLECIYERNDWKAFREAAASLPEYASGEPWFLTRLRGELALHDEDWQGAVLFFERVLAADPANPWSNMGLARAFAGLGRSDERAKAQHRSAVIARIRVNLVNAQEESPDAVERIAEECAELGFREAAEAFGAHAARIRAAAGEAQP